MNGESDSESDDSGYDRMSPQNERQTYSSAYKCTECQIGIGVEVNESLNDSVFRGLWRFIKYVKPLNCFSDEIQ